MTGPTLTLSPPWSLMVLTQLRHRLLQVGGNDGVAEESNADVGAGPARS